MKLHEKVFHVIKKEVNAAQKIISCRRKQDDAASKKYFVRKKVIFFRNGAPIFLFKRFQINQKFIYINLCTQRIYFEINTLRFV